MLILKEERPFPLNQKTNFNPKSVESKSRTNLNLERVISGGQTGVDRAALDWAMECKIPCGGWCPAGRRAEDAPIDEKYPLKETTSHKYAQRTRWNVRDSDGTLILNIGELTGGTELTVKYCQQLEKSFLVVDLKEDFDPDPVEEWITNNTISVLNIAGPRESSSPGIGKRTIEFLHTLKTE